jgi:hypothetical protein
LRGLRCNDKERRGIYNEPRAVPMYLLRLSKKEKPDEIGNGFRMAKYSSIGSEIKGMKMETFRNRKLRNRVEHT